MGSPINTLIKLHYNVCFSKIKLVILSFEEVEVVLFCPQQEKSNALHINLHDRNLNTSMDLRYQFSFIMKQMPKLGYKQPTFSSGPGYLFLLSSSVTVFVFHLKLMLRSKHFTLIRQEGRERKACLFKNV